MRFNTSYVTAFGAYGREAAEADWITGKDFKIVNGPYFSIRDIEAMKKEGIEQIIFLNCLSNVAFYKDL